MHRIKKLYNEHNSIILISLGALSLFISNILLKDILNETEYGEYSLLITYLQLIASFGLLGMEHVFTRVSKVAKDKIITSKKLFIIILIIWQVFTLLFSFIFKKYFFETDIPFYYILLFTLVISLSTFGYNVFRIKSSFSLSQFILNFWKIILGILVVSILFMKNIDLKDIISFLFYPFCFIFIIQLFLLIKKIHFKFELNISYSEILLFSIHFFITILTLSVINYGDRFFIKTNIGIEQLGEYFYLATIYIFPFSLFQTYIGFKQLVYFKDNTILNLRSKLLYINILGVVFGLFIFISTMVINSLEILPKINIDDNLWLIVVFLLTGLVKLNYSLFSALLGAKTNVKTIKRTNIQSLLVIFIIFILFYKYLDNVLLISFTVLIFWISRTLIYVVNLHKLLNFNVYNHKKEPY
jgi:O-antigen/teichoic acid export membrane protein